MPILNLNKTRNKRVSFVATDSPESPNASIEPLPDTSLQPDNLHSVPRTPPPSPAIDLPEPSTRPLSRPLVPTYQDFLPNMSTVGAGLMPDPHAVHYQPPVPETANGPYQHVYVPRADQSGLHYAAGGPPLCPPPSYPFQQAQPGMATAPMPMMVSGQPPFIPPHFTSSHPMLPHPMAAPFQPGSMPPMVAAPAPGGPVYVAAGVGQSPPMVPPNAYFAGGNHGGLEMGRTKTELDAETRYNATSNQMNEPQGIKPADDDASRMYWCCELDGQWTSRSRFSLDRMGNFRWYVFPDGVFYAKMLVE